MKNKFRRSMTSVLLAASLLFSSQSVIAFADYGSKSDASDLSPVQESVETVVKDEQTTVSPEEPAKNGEEGEQEKTETPEKPAEGEGEEQDKPETETPKTPADPSAVALAALETANTDADFYDISGLPANHYFTYSSGDEGIDSVYCSDKNETFSGFITIGDKICTQTGTVVWEDDYENVTTFTVTTKLGYELFHLYGDNVTENDFTPLGNNKYEFRFTDNGAEDLLDKNVSFSLETAKIQYKFIDEEGNSLGTATIGERISLPQPEEKPGYEFIGWYVGDIKLEGPLTEDIIAYADENNQIKVEAKYEDNKPFWTFKADKNGKVQLNDEAPKDSIVFTKTQVEALNNGKDDFLFVVPNEGYGFAGCTGNQVLVETGLCLDNLNKNVEFYSTAHFNPLVNITFNPGDHGTLVDSSKSTGTITSDYNLAYLAFPEVTPDDGYKLVGWKREGSSEIETVSVKTPVEYVTEGITYIAQYEEVPAEQITDLKIHIGDNLSKKYSKEGLAGTYLYRLGYDLIPLHAEYGSQYILTTSNLQGTFSDADVSKLPKDLTIEYDTIEEVQSFFQGFTYMNLIIDKPYIDNSHIVNVRVEGTTLHITLDIPAPEAPANINELLDVTLNCENPDHPEEYGKSKTYSDLLPNSYTIGEVKNNNGTYTCDITINPEEYLADYNNVTKTNHILVTTPENLTGIATVTLKYEDGAWKTAESPVTFTVTCKQSIPLTPSKPSDDVVKAIMDKISVTVDCTNTTGHDPMNHTLTGAEFTVGDIYSVAPFADQDPVILCPVTINNYVSLQNGFITQYNAATNESHTLSSGFIPASIVLTYNKDAQDGKGAWENHDLENITLSLTCNPTTPGGGGEGTNPGGNGGDNDDDDDRYTGGNTVTRTINDDDVPLNDRPNNTTTIDDEDVPLADLPDDTVTIDDGEVPLKDNPSTGDSLPFAAMAAAALSLGGVIVLNRKKK